MCSQTCTVQVIEKCERRRLLTNQYKSAISIKVQSIATHGGDERAVSCLKSLCRGFPSKNVPEEYVCLSVSLPDRLDLRNRVQFIPRMIFPFLRRGCKRCDRDGGFSALNLDTTIDLFALYRNGNRARQPRRYNKRKTDATWNSVLITQRLSPSLSIKV